MVKSCFGATKALLLAQGRFYLKHIRIVTQFGLGANSTAFISLNTLDKSNPVAFGLNLIILFPHALR
jgi:hypothetical protein